MGGTALVCKGDLKRTLGKGVENGWGLVDTWEYHLLAKLADIASRNAVERLAVLSKRQLDTWTTCPKCGRQSDGSWCPFCKNYSLGGFDVSGKTKSISKRKRYYERAPRAMGFELRRARLGGVEQEVWLRAARRPDKAPPGPELPNEIVHNTAAR